MNGTSSIVPTRNESGTCEVGTIEQVMRFNTELTETTEQKGFLSFSTPCPSCSPCFKSLYENGNDKSATPAHATPSSAEKIPAPPLAVSFTPVPAYAPVT